MLEIDLSAHDVRRPLDDVRLLPRHALILLLSPFSVLDHLPLGLGPLHGQRPRDEPAVTREQLAALEEERFPAV
jgi:hypothetical protein